MQAVTAATVSLSVNVTADVPAGSPITFVLAGNAPLPATTATSTADCAAGAVLLTFAGPGGTTGISAGMSAFGAGIAAGCTAQSVTATTITLSTAVTADIPAGSAVTFAIVPSTLTDQITAWLPDTTSPSTPDPTVATLKQVTAAQWASLFTQTGSPQWLPPFTQPVTPGASSGQTAPQAGYVATRIRAFIRAVQQFFTVSSVATAAQLPAAGAAATFELPGYDPIGLAATDIPGGFNFGGALAGTDLAAAAQEVVPGDPAAQGWLVQAMTTINELWEIASVVPDPTLPVGALPYPVSFSFSVMEALYARGFQGAADIRALSAGDFQQALTGRVAYDFHVVL